MFYMKKNKIISLKHVYFMYPITLFANNKSKKFKFVFVFSESVFRITIIVYRCVRGKIIFTKKIFRTFCLRN